MPNMECLETMQYIEAFSNYLDSIGAHPKDLLNCKGGIILLEYSESGRGLYSFLTALKQVSENSKIDPKKVFQKMKCQLIIPDNHFKKSKHNFDKISKYCSYESMIFKGKELSIEALCNDDTVRINPSQKWYKTEDVKH